MGLQCHESVCNAHCSWGVHVHTPVGCAARVCTSLLCRLHKAVHLCQLHVFEHDIAAVVSDVKVIGVNSVIHPINLFMNNEHYV